MTEPLITVLQAAAALERLRDGVRRLAGELHRASEHYSPAGSYLADVLDISNRLEHLHTDVVVDSYFKQNGDAQ